MTAYRTACYSSNSATSAISSADWPGALARIPRHRVSRSVLDGSAGTVQLRHQLAMRQECSQPLLGRHALDVLAQAAASSIGQLRFHAAMRNRQVNGVKNRRSPTHWSLRAGKAKRPQRGRSLRFDGSGGALLRLKEDVIEVELR